MEFLRTNKLTLHLLVGILLTLVYPIQELFSGNQNIYFLWGSAELLPGTFDADPLLNSPDPYPLFSWLIGIFPIQYLAAWTTFLYAILQAVYSYSLFGIADKLAKIYAHPQRLISFLTLFLFLHTNAIWGPYLGILTGTDIRWVWDSGIAEQGVLRGYLQPSTFGIFLILSFRLAMERKYSWAIFWIAPAAIMHAGYLFIGCALVCMYLFYSRLDKKAMRASTLLLLMVAPYTYYISQEFLMIGNDAKLAIESAVRSGFENNIHLNPANWLNPKFYVQLAIIFLAVLVTWKTRICKLILAILIVSAALTICAYAIDSMTLMSLNPWRFSIIIIPVCSAMLLSKIVSSGIWQSAHPYFLVFLGIISGAIVYFRVMGNASDSFVSNWLWVQIGLILGCFICIRIMKAFDLQKPFKVLELLVITGFVLTGLTELYLERIHKNQTNQFIAISAFQDETEKATLYVVPPEWTSFRMNAGKSVFADNNLVYGPALPDLMHRLELLETARISGNYLPILNTIPDSVSVKLVLDDDSYEGSRLEQSSMASIIKIYKLR